MFFISLILSFILYGNTINGEFLLDDYFYSQRAELRQVSYLPKLFTESVLPWHKEAGLFRPLSVFTIALNFIFFGESPVSFHVVSILLNALAVYLVFLLIKRLTGDKYKAIFGALFFAFLPIHTEAVSYIKGRDEILGTIFVLLSILFFFKRKTFFSIIFYFLAILSKEFTIVLPIFLVFLKPKSLKNLYYLIPAGLMLILRHIALDGGKFAVDDIEFIANPLKYSSFAVGFFTAFKIFYLYIQKIFIPINLSASYHFNHLKLESSIFDIEVVLGIFLVIIFIYLIFSKKIKSSFISIGSVFYLIFYLPFSQFIFKGGDIMGERWIYLPSVGISVIVGSLFANLYKRWGKSVAVLFAIILVIYAGIIIKRNKDWKNQLSISESMIRSAPDSIKGFVVAGYSELEKGNTQKAKEYADKSISIYDKYAPSWDLMGGISYQMKDYQRARESMEKVLSIDPTNANAYTNLARLEYQAGNFNRSYELLDLVIKQTSPHPRIVDVVFLAQVLTKLGKYSQSDKLLDEYRELITPELNYDYNQIRKINNEKK